MIRIALDIGSRKHRYALNVDGKIEEGELVNERPILLTFFKTLIKRDRDVRVVMEQTGVYHWEAALAAHGAGLEVVLISPRQSVNFARALNTRTKTDRVDARMLLQYLERMPFERWYPPGNHLMELRTIARYLAGLSDQLTATRNQLHACAAQGGAPKFVTRAHQLEIQRLEHRIKNGRKEAMKRIEGDQQLKAQFDALDSMVGVAETAAIALVSELALLPTDLKAKACCAHAGLDVRHHESGSSVQKPGRLSKQGNAYLRRALYMPAMVAVVHDPAAKAHYEQLVARGKKKLQALCAVMRKMLTAAWSMMKSRESYDGVKLYQAKTC